MADSATYDPNAALLAAISSGNNPAITPQGATEPPVVAQPAPGGASAPAATAHGSGQAAAGTPPGSPMQIVRDEPATTAPAAPASTAAPATPAAPATAAAPDPFRDWLTQEKPGAPQWSDDAKKVFHATYGEADPIAYRDSVQKRLAEADLLKKDADTARTIQANLQRIEKENPVLHAALIEQMEGRDGLDYISKMPSANVLNKSAKELSDEVLINTYLKDKFSDEERRAKRTGDFSDVAFDKDALDAKYSMLRPVAEQMHEQRQNELRGRIESRDKEMAAAREREAQALSATLAYAQGDPVAKLHVNQESIDALRDGSIFQGVFLNPDGTLHPNALAALVRAKHYDGDVRRALAIGEERGYQRGLQEGTSRMPVPSGGRAVNNPQQPGGDPNLAVIASMVR